MPKCKDCTGYGWGACVNALPNDESCDEFELNEKGNNRMKVMLERGAQMPTKAHETDAGYDLYATSNKYIATKSSGIIETGVHIQIPQGYFGIVAGRSGLNFKEGLIVPQGTIDSGYTGSIKVKLYNMTGDSKTINRGDRIAQIIFLKCESPEFEQVDALDETDRGKDGFGSTGK